MPMQVKVIIDDARLRALQADLPDRMDRAAQRVAREAKGIAEAMMAEPKSGRVYGDHVASAPGEAPAIDTTELIKSGYTQRGKKGTWVFGYYAEHALYLELGTVRMEPRPFVYPAIAKAADTLMAQAVRDEINR